MNLKQLTGLLVIPLLLAAPRLHGEEQLEQETISIQGNKGLPKTLYIAPWKRVGSPLEGEELEGKFREETDPVEPDLLQRELELHK
ncbi:MAG: hypothetical protein ACC648_05710, partial [Thiohalobacterales bacterium]